MAYNNIHSSKCYTLVTKLINLINLQHLQRDTFAICEGKVRGIIIAAVDMMNAIVQPHN